MWLRKTILALVILFFTLSLTSGAIWLSKTLNTLKLQNQQLMAEINALKQDEKEQRAAKATEDRDRSEALSGIIQQTSNLAHKLEALAQTVTSLGQGVVDLTERAGTLDHRFSVYDTALGQLQKKQNDQQDTAARLNNKLHYTVGFLLSQLPGTDVDASPKSFSYFNGDEWQRNIGDFIVGISGFRMGAPLQMGGGALDTISYGPKGPVYLDGIFYRGIELLKVGNNQPNTVFVTMPGLSSVHEASIEIVTDASGDTVMLDGCVNWKKGKQSGGSIPWTAIDSAGEKRIVRISRGAAVKVQSRCNQRYAEIQLSRIVPALWAVREKMPMPSFFPLPSGGQGQE